MLKIDKLGIDDGLEELGGKTLLLDTCVFIDAAEDENKNRQGRYVDDFREFFGLVKLSGCCLATTVAVVIEFLRGANDVNAMRNAREFLAKICDGILSEELADSMNDLGFMLAYYGSARNKNSLVDYLLARLLKRFPKSTYLLTNNHADFSPSIFERTHNIIVGQGKEAETYGIYQFSQARYDDWVEDIDRMTGLKNSHAEIRAGKGKKCAHLKI